MHYLYKITNQINQKVYIGQSKEDTGRWKQHKYFAKNPEKTGQYIHRAMAKYGVQNFEFEVIACCVSQPDADYTEVQLIEQYDSRNPDKGYNIKPGGKTWDDDFRRKMSEIHKQRYVDHPEARELSSRQSLKMWQNRSIEDKQSIIKPLMDVGIKTRFKPGHISAPYERTLEQRQYLSQIQIGKKQSPESIAKTAEYNRTHPNSGMKQPTQLTKDQIEAIKVDKRSNKKIAKDYHIGELRVKQIRGLDDLD